MVEIQKQIWPCCPQEVAGVFKRYSQVQDDDIWHQLLYGIRYLDLRVSLDATTPEKYWIAHDFVKMNPLYKVVQDIRRFVQNSNEILIMDFHRFPDGFGGEGVTISIHYLEKGSPPPV